MSDSATADAIVVSQRALGICVDLERSIADLEAELDDIDRRVTDLERDLDE